MATNRADTLDPALLRPGRLDRKIEFPLPSRREKRLIFQTVTSKMNLGPDVDLEDCESNHILFQFPLLNRAIFHRCFATRSVVVSRNCFHCPSRWAPRYALNPWHYSNKLLKWVLQLFARIAMSFSPWTLRKPGRCVIWPC